jgi:hypothetical protein
MVAEVPLVEDAASSGHPVAAEAIPPSAASLAVDVGAPPAPSTPEESKAATREQVKGLLKDVVSTPPSPTVSRLSLQPFHHLPARAGSTSSPPRASSPDVPVKPITVGDVSRDLKSIALAFARLLPYFPPGHPVRAWTKRLFAPPFRRLLAFAAVIFQKRGIMPADLIYVRLRSCRP